MPSPLAGKIGRAAGAVPRLQGGVFRFAVLTGHFFGRFFRNEVVDFADQMKERLIAILAVLAGVFGWSSMELLFSYQMEWRPLSQSWQEKTFLFTVMAGVFAAAAALVWDSFLPDRRDYVNLTPLPVATRTIVLAKLASFALLAAIFTLGMNALAAPVFGLLLTPPRTGSLAFVLRLTGAHLLAGFALNLTILFALLAVQSVVLAVVPARLARPALSLARFAILGGVVLLLVVFVANPGLLLRGIRDLDPAGATGRRAFSAFPPFWFVALYERLLGTPDPAFAGPARLALLSLAAAIPVFFGAAAFGYQRHARRTLEVRKGSARLGRWRAAAAAPFRAVFLPHPEERAAHAFAASALRSNPAHRSRMTMTLGIAAGLAAAFVLATRKSFRALTPGNLNLLALPLFLALFSVAGWRRLAALPARSEADWLFQVSESPRRELFLRGARKAFLGRSLLPFWAAVGIASSFLPAWTPAAAAAHAAFGFVLSTLALEASFLGTRKIPFVGSSVPGKLRVERWIVPVPIAAYLFLAAATRLERALLARPAAFAAFLAVAAGASALLRVEERRRLRGRAFVYDEEPEPALVTFSET